MTFTSAMLGGFSGFLIQCFSNKIKKIPLSRQPWLHVGCTMIGMYVGQKLPQWELKLVEDINEIRSSKGMAPMVGTNAWIKYKMPEGDGPLPKKY